MAEETREGQGLSPFIDQIAAELRRPVRLDPRFDDRVMAALEAPEVIPLHPTRQADRPGSRPWIIQPRTIRMSPIGAFAVAAGLMAAVAIGSWRLRGVEQVQMANSTIGEPNLVPVSNTGAEPLVVHQFTYYQKGLESIALVGNFNDWKADSTTLTEVSPGVWTVSVALRPGVYEYQFILNGKQRVADPTMPQTSSDFGSPNSVVKISPKVPQ